MKQKKTKGLGRNSKVLLLLIIIIASITGFGLYSYLNTLRVPVYLFAAAYEQETPISEIEFIKVEMDVDTYHAIAGTGVKYASAEDIAAYKAQGDVLYMNVASHTPFTLNQAVSTGGSRLESRLGKNMVSVELLCENVSGLSVGVRPGSRINLLSSFTRGDVKETDLHYENLLVLDTSEDENGQIRSVFVELEPAEAVELVHCLTYEVVTANVLKPGQYIEVPEAGKAFKKDYAPEEESAGFWGNQTEGQPMNE